MSGSVEMLVFPEAYRKLQEKVKLEVPVLIRGGVRIEEGANPKLTVNEIHSAGRGQSSAAAIAAHSRSARDRERDHGRCLAHPFSRAQGRGQGVV